MLRDRFSNASATARRASGAGFVSRVPRCAVAALALLLALMASPPSARAGEGPDVDITIRKLGIPQTPIAGTIFQYRYVLTNHGPEDAFDVSVQDTFPEGMEFLESDSFCNLGAIPDPNDPIYTMECRPAGTPFSSPPYVLPAGESVTFNAYIRLAPNLLGPITNSASAGVGNDSFSITSFGDVVNVICESDLKITKVADREDALAGEQCRYYIVAENVGPSTADNVVIRDTLMTSSGDFVRANGCSLAVRTDGGAIDEFDCNFALSTGIFDLGTFGSNHLNPVSPDDLGRIIITIDFIAEQDITLNNIVSVTSDCPDPNPDNNMAMTVTHISASADMSVTKTATGEVQVSNQPGSIINIASPPAFPEAPGYATSDTQVTAGRRIAYTIEVENNGPSTTENVIVRDRLPAGVTIVPGTLVATIFDPNDVPIDTGNCETGTPGDPFDLLECGLGKMHNTDDPFEDDENENLRVRAVITFQVAVDSSIAPGTVLENDVSVTSDSVDVDNTNNLAHTQTIVNTWADMVITKLSVGENVIGWDANLRRNILQDLPGQVTAGRGMRYEITVQNTGASDAQNVQILDLLPGQTDTGLTHDPVIFLHADGADCRPLDHQQEIGVFGPGGGKFGQVVWCDLGTIPAGARRTFDIYVATDPAIPDATEMDNGVFVWWGASSPPAQPGDFLPFPFPQIPPALPTTDDPFLTDNFFATTTIVNAVADAHVVKADVPALQVLDQPFEPDRAVAGREHRYLITFGNNGPSVAQAVGVSDVLDEIMAGVQGELFARCEPVSPTDSVTCAENVPGTVDVESFLTSGDAVIAGAGNGTLSPGEAFSFYLITEVVADYLDTAPDSIALNQAMITTTTTEFRTGNNADSEATEIVDEAFIAIADLRIVKFGKPDGDVQAGDELVYTVIVDNLGPDTATEVSIKDLMQSDGDFDVVEILSDRAMTCNSLPAADGGNPFNVPPDDGAATGVSERYQLDCTLDDPLEVLQADGPPNSGRWVMTVRVRANEQQDIDNVADVLTAVTDPNPANNHAEVEHAINEVVDLAIEKVAVPDQGPPNGLVTYVLTVTNNGPSTAGNVVVTDIVPVEFAISGVTSSQGVCDIGTPGDPTDPTLCLLGTIAAGDTATINIDVVLPPDEIEATYYNRATVVGDQFDPNNSNNLSIAPVTVVLPPPQTQPAEQPSVGLCGPAPMFGMVATIMGLVGMRRIRRR